MLNYAYTQNIGLGFHTRNRRDRDVDDEIDIDGDDQTYGDAQFTEGDILGSTIISRANDDTEVGMEEDGEGHPQVQQKSLRELIAEGRSGRHVDHGLGGPSNSRVAEEELDPMLLKMNLAVRLARKENDRIGLISALENKVNYLVSLAVLGLFPCGNSQHNSSRKSHAHQPQAQPRCSVEYAWTLTTSRRFRLGAGTHVAENVG